MARAFIVNLKATGYFYPMQKVIQIVGELSLMFNCYAPFSAVVLFPISLNVLLLHTFLVPSGWLVVVPNLLLGYANRKYYSDIFTMKAFEE